MSKIKKDYEKAVYAYLNAFAKKHELDIVDTYWIPENSVGTGTLSWGDMYLNFSDIKEDIDNNYDCFMSWYWDTVEAQLKDQTLFINLFSYNLGLRYEMPTEQQRLIKDGYKRIIHDTESIYSTDIDANTTLNVVFSPKFNVFVSQGVSRVYLDKIENIEQLFHFQNQIKC